MIEKLFESLNDNVISRITICSDSQSEFLSNIIFDMVVDILLNKKLKKMLIYNCNNDNNTFNHNIQIYNAFVLNLPYTVTVNNVLLLNSEILHYSNVVIILKDNKLTLKKHHTLNPQFYIDVDMIPLIRYEKIKKLKNNIYNKN